jgi:hypothetical protein
VLGDSWTVGTWLLANFPNSVESKSTWPLSLCHQPRESSWHLKIISSSYFSFHLLLDLQRVAGGSEGRFHNKVTAFRSLYRYFFLKGFIALININHTCKLQNCSLINQFTTISLHMHVGEFDLAKITAVKTITQYTKNTAATGWNYNRRCLVRLWLYFLYRCWRSTIEQSPICWTRGFWWIEHW